ncbi:MULTISPECIES: DUF2306 domain-containing protein [unclassified Pseudoxanthomonas]|uniref:DUF2306 domain-containing protein n=1 Tax=unclassified Pseudoxanthomonas TaxID=2645906 RepID=UPI0008E611AC|nr:MULTISPECIES: DUF2306 domain-containing protein [unclassified Pseudoxanthomonas]PPJ43922.1 DUF2306 domain-containing protein [Pseudoxanthomonas sp. KAs_5_3]SFV36531.1 Predicted membrane protein [Pseudoxanthomonas sp. YR558]
MKLFGTIWFYILAIGVAGYAVFAYGFMPLGSLVHPDMKINFLAHKMGIYTHVFASLVALSLSPFQFSSRLRSTRHKLHRIIGRTYLGVGVALGGLSGLYMSAFAFGGYVAKLGFACLAVCWLFTGLRAFQSIRMGAVQEHRKWVVRNVSLTLAAVTLRIYLPSSMIAGIPFELAYPVIAWLCWVPNLLVAELAFAGTYNKSFKPKSLRGSA